MALSPPFWGLKIVDIQVSDLLKHLDKSTLYQARWKYEKGNLETSEHKRILREKADPALDQLLKLDANRKIFAPKATYGYFRCRSSGDSLELFDAESASIGVFSFPRQSQKPRLCIVDYFSSIDGDFIALWLATIGEKASKYAAKLYKQNEYLQYHLFHGLAVELAECGAKYLQSLITGEISESSPGIGTKKIKSLRFSFGFPSCPDLNNQKILLNILRADKIKVALTETCQMVPEQSVSGFLVFHPDAKYFIP